MSDEYASTGFQGSLVNDCEEQKSLLDYMAMANVGMGHTAEDLKDLPPQVRDAVTGNYPAPDDYAFRLKTNFLAANPEHMKTKATSSGGDGPSKNNFAQRGKESTTRTGDASEGSQDAGLVTQSSSGGNLSDDVKQGLKVM
jgi:hypothetical protein